MKNVLQFTRKKKRAKLQATADILEPLRCGLMVTTKAYFRE